MANYDVIVMIQKLYIPDSPEVWSLLPPLHCVLQFKIEQQVTEPIRGQTCRQCWMIFSRVFMSKIQLAQSFLRIRMHALNRLGCINLQNLCGHHQEEVLRFPKHPLLAQFDESEAKLWCSKEDRFFLKYF